MCIASENGILIPQIGQCPESGRGGGSFTPRATLRATLQIGKPFVHLLGMASGPTADKASPASLSSKRGHFGLGNHLLTSYEMDP
jgi:hypothetical protein